MPREQFDIIIIGGGVTGAAIAHKLSHYQITVALLEKEVELAFGVSKANSGIIHPGTQNPVNSLKGKLCVRGNYLIRKISKTLGMHFLPVGELMVITDPKDLPRLQEILADGKKLKVPGIKIVDRAWLNKHEPNLDKSVIAALYAPTAGVISPYRLTYDLAENAQDNGVKIFTDHCVQNIQKENTHFTITTNQKIFTSRFVINAAGLYADDIARMVGITDFKITPRKGEEYLLDKKREHIINHVIFPLPTPTTKGTLIIKTSDGNPMIGPTAEDIQDKTDTTTTEAGFQKVISQVQALVPAIKQQDIIAYFAGLRPTAGSDFIIRHEDTVPGMITVAGIQSPGLTAAPANAEYVATLLKQNGCRLRRKFNFIKYTEPAHHLFLLPFKKIKQIIKHNAGFGDIVCRCELVSAEEVREAIRRGATTLDGIKFRTRAQAGRCHGGFCTTRIMKILAEETGQLITDISKNGHGSYIVKGNRHAKI